jgi:hypothetical protein
MLFCISLRFHSYKLEGPTGHHRIATHSLQAQPSSMWQAPASCLGNALQGSEDKSKGKERFVLSVAYR